MGFAHTKYTCAFDIRPLVHSLVMVMDSSRQSSHKDAGAREVDHFTQIVFHTERNHRHLDHPGKQLDTHNVLQPTQHNLELIFSWYSRAQRVTPSFTTHLLQQLSQDTLYSWSHLGKTTSSSLGTLSWHCYLPYNIPFECL